MPKKKTPPLLLLIGNLNVKVYVELLFIYFRCWYLAFGLTHLLLKETRF